MTSALSLSNVCVDYGSFRAVDGVTLEVGEGTICGIVGQNGSGKTTLFKAILQLVPLADGTISIAGVDGAQARSQGLIGYVPQAEEIDPDFPLSVDDVVMMGRYGFMGSRRKPRQVDHDAVDHALRMVNMTDLRNRQIGALSGGQRKRAFIARAIAQGAQIMLLDEPFAGVDKPSETSIIELLHRLRDEGKTILVSTHDLASLTTMCDQVALLYRSIMFLGPPDKALEPDNLALAFGRTDHQGGQSQ